MAVRVRFWLVFVMAVGWLNLGAPAVARARAPGTVPPLVTTRPDVILLIGIDTLRADHLPAYGYFRSTTPNLDYYVASQGRVFLGATSSSPWTFPGNGAVHTALSPFRNGLSWQPFQYPLPARATTLAELMHEGGYRTAGFISNLFVSHYTGFAQGFDHFDDSLLTYPQENPGCAAALTDRVITWTDQLTQTGPLFLFMWYVDPHTWYNPPPPYDLAYDPVYTGTLTPAAYGGGNSAAVTSPRDLEHLLALYDGEISFTDEQIGRLLAYFDGRGMLEDALVVVYADHGELFGEHDLWAHGNSVYEDLLRVPLMIRYTGVVTPGRGITTPVQSFDAMPTILDYAGIPIPAGLDGVSLRPLLEGAAPPDARPIYGEVDAVTDPAHWQYWNASRFDLRSMRLGDWKYIHHVGDEGNDELYRLNPDPPYETENLILSEPARAAAMRQQLQNYYMINFTYLPALLRAVP